MQTMTKFELLKIFENQEFIQINFPKVKTSTNDKEEIPNDTVLHMRSKVQNLDHFNCVYKDGNKFYLEDNVEACARVVKRAYSSFFGGINNVEYTCIDLEHAEYCLYLADYDMKEAVKIMQRRY